MQISEQIVISQERIDSYGRANGDSERLHYDEVYAKAAGFRGPIAHGTLLAAPLFDLAIKKYGVEFLWKGSLALKWTAPVCAGDVQVATIEDDGRVEVVVVTVPGGAVSIRGQCSCNEK